MAQRIQAPLNAGLCLIISREGLSMVPLRKRDRESERKRERDGKTAEETLKAREKQVQDLVVVGDEKREKKTCPCGHVTSLL